MAGHEQHGRHVFLRVGTLAVLLAFAGVAALIVAWRAQIRPPQPPPSAARVAGPHSGPAAGSHTSGHGSAKGLVLAASIPTKLTIPAIGVTSSLLRLGLNSDRTVQVPPLARDSQAGWYEDSPTPGELGPSLILGHVDSAEYGPGVFFKLGALRPGDTVSINRADHSTAVFRIDRVVSYPKDHFPTIEVYGNTDHAALRLITCGGKFDFSTHNYENNIVAYASLVSHHAS